MSNKFGDIASRKKSNISDFIDGADQYQNKSTPKQQKKESNKDNAKKEPMERLNVEVPKSLHKQLKLKAVEQGTTIKEIVINAINDHLIK